MSFPTVVAWAYRTPFLKAAERLRSRLDVMGYEHWVEDSGPWMREHMARRLPNVNERNWLYRFAPGFLLRMLDMHGDILYLHADHHLQARIPVAWESLDVGVQWRERGQTWGLTIMAAPLFFRDTRLARGFLLAWESKCMKTDADLSEHVLLGQLVGDLMGGRIGTFSPPIASPWKDSLLPIRDDKWPRPVTSS